MDRRNFLSTALEAVTATACSTTQASEPAARKLPFIGVQIHPFSFYDEGIERVLDLLQETASINALFVYSHLYASDQQMPAEVLAHDHPGFTPIDPKLRRYRRVWARHVPGEFDGQLLRHAIDAADVEFAGKDLFAELAPQCHKRGMKLLGRILEPRGRHGAELIQNFSQVLTVSLDGKPGTNACWNNPDYRSFWQVTVADTFRQNPLEGFMLGAERTGPLYRLIQAGESPSCFCRHCQLRMKDREISERRLRTGYAAINEWIQAMRRGASRPADGALVTFLRLLMRHPEVLAWEREWALSLEESLGALVRSIKSVKPAALVGRHIDHQQSSWDIFYRAAVSYSEMAESMNFLKPVVYHDIAAPRVNRWMLAEFSKSILSDLSQTQSLDLYYAVFGLDPQQEPAFQEMLSGSFSPDYVYRETKRCVDSVGGRTLVYPGIGFDIPFHRPNAPPLAHPSQPDVLAAAATKAFEAGAEGIVVCREYQEMRLPNLRAIGRAVRDLPTSGSKSR